MSETVTKYSACDRDGLVARWLPSLEEARADVRELDEKYPCDAPHYVIEHKITEKRIPDPLPTTPGSVAVIDGVMRVLLKVAGYGYRWRCITAVWPVISQSEAARSESVTVLFDAASIKGDDGDAC